MSEVREQLIQAIDRKRPALFLTTKEDVVDAILERFEVTAKPVVTVEELGRMVERAWLVGDGFEGRGAQMLNLLEAAGLTIVRIEEGAR